jgi:hypothetical protein
VQAAHAADGFVAGAEIEVVGVAEDDLGAEGFEHVLGTALTVPAVPTGMKTGVSTVWWGKDELGAAAAGLGLRPCRFRVPSLGRNARTFMLARLRATSGIQLPTSFRRE